MRSCLSLVSLAFLLASCGNRDSSSTLPRAKLQLRDGTSLTGQVVSSSPRQIVVAADGNATRTLDMKQVKSIEYEEPAESMEHTADTGMARKHTPTQAGPAARVSESADGHDAHFHPAESDVRTRTYVLPAGTQIAIRTEETIDSAKAVEGQTYAAEVARAVADAQGDTVLPKGANAQIIIRSVTQGGRFKGTSDLVLDLKTVSIEGRRYAVDTVDLEKKGNEGIGANKRTAEFGGVGAAVGAVIGAIAGGGKGAAIGAGAGAGGGVLGQVLTKGQAIRIPAETVLTFKLEKALRVVAAQ